MLELKTRLVEQLEKFEEKYALNSSVFYSRYKNGEMGDDTDFIEWAATVEMLTNAERRLALLQSEEVQEVMDVTNAFSIIGKIETSLK